MQHNVEKVWNLILFDHSSIHLHKEWRLFPLHDTCSDSRLYINQLLHVSMCWCISIKATISYTVSVQACTLLNRNDKADSFVFDVHWRHLCWISDRIWAFVLSCSPQYMKQQLLYRMTHILSEQKYSFCVSYYSGVSCKCVITAAMWQVLVLALGFTYEHCICF